MNNQKASNMFYINSLAQLSYKFLIFILYQILVTYMILFIKLLIENIFRLYFLLLYLLKLFIFLNNLIYNVNEKLYKLIKSIVNYSSEQV